MLLYQRIVSYLIYNIATWSSERQKPKFKWLIILKVFGSILYQILSASLNDCYAKYVYNKIGIAVLFQAIFQWRNNDVQNLFTKETT